MGHKFSMHLKDGILKARMKKGFRACAQQEFHRNRIEFAVKCNRSRLLQGKGAFVLSRPCDKPPVEYSDLNARTFKFFAFVVLSL